MVDQKGTKIRSTYENSRTKIVLRTCEVQVGLHALNLCIADVRPIQEAEQVEESQHWNEAYIHLAKRLLRIDARGVDPLARPVWIMMLGILFRLLGKGPNYLAM